ncbi:MAG: hypothetical protein JWQ66_291 [Mucilaginibacter sp.]|nr:hypothetical protein [Mucilaginibacter sp.]
MIAKQILLLTTTIKAGGLVKKLSYQTVLCNT